MSAKPQTIMRGQKDADHPYAQIRKETLQNKSLSFEARGMLAYILSQPDDWEVRIHDLEQECGKDRVYRILKELKAAGYVTRNRYRDDSGRWQYEPYKVFEVPQNSVYSSVSGKPVNGQPVYGKEQSQNPDTEKPDLKDSTKEQNNKEINTNNVVVETFDLLSQNEVEKWIQQHKPEFIETACKFALAMDNPPGWARWAMNNPDEAHSFMSGKKQNGKKSANIEDDGMRFKRSFEKYGIPVDEDNNEDHREIDAPLRDIEF